MFGAGEIDLLARIVHVLRDPVDTCLSCFSAIFGSPHPYSYDLGELGRYYRAYRSPMAHWQRYLPNGIMLELRYEELVADPEANVRRLLDHCDLDWDSACLSFHQSTRPVGTASVSQVRQPLNRSGIGRWQPSAAQIAPYWTRLVCKKLYPETRSIGTKKSPAELLPRGQSLDLSTRLTKPGRCGRWSARRGSGYAYQPVRRSCRWRSEYRCQHQQTRSGRCCCPRRTRPHRSRRQRRPR